MSYVSAMIRNILFPVVLLSGAFLQPSTTAFAQDIPLIFVESDDKTTEQEIKKYLDQRTDWSVEIAYFGQGRNDAYIRIPFTLTDGRQVFIYIDSLSSASQGQERRINIYGYFKINASLNPTRRAALLEVLNQHSVDDWMMQRLYLDKDNDIAFAWTINIPGEDSPIHAEQIYDAIIRTKFSLDQLMPKLRPLGLP